MLVFISWFISTCLLIIPAQNPQPEFESVEVNFTFDPICKGPIYLACFQKEEGFIDITYAAYAETLECQSSVIMPNIDANLPRAVMGYIDDNGNGVLDKNFFGIPIEPYAVSNNFRSKWKEPTFTDAAEPTTSKKMLLEFKYWKNQ